MTKRIVIVSMIIICISHTQAFADVGLLWTVRHAVVSLKKDETVLLSSQPETNEMESEEFESEVPPEEEPQIPSEIPIIEETEPSIAVPETKEIGSEEFESEVPPEEENSIPALITF